MSTFRENDVPKIIYTAPILWKLIHEQENVCSMNSSYFLSTASKYVIPNLDLNARD